MYEYSIRVQVQTLTCEGALGTCLEADNVPYVHWDNEDFNTTSYNGTPCYAEVHTCLKRVKG